MPESHLNNGYAARDYVSRMQGGGGLQADMQRAGAATPFYQSQAFLDAIWAPVNNGGVPANAEQGAAQQQQTNQRLNQQLQANNYLPPGVTREGLIAQARQRAPQSFNIDYGAPTEAAAQAAGANSTMPQPTSTAVQQPKYEMLPGQSVPVRGGQVVSGIFVTDAEIQQAGGDPWRASVMKANGEL